MAMELPYELALDREPHAQIQTVGGLVAHSNVESNWSAKLCDHRKNQRSRDAFAPMTWMHEQPSNGIVAASAKADDLIGIFH